MRLLVDRVFVGEQELPVHQRGDAVSSMVYEANARVRDPVYGCVGAISSLQHQIDVLQTQLALAQAEVVHMRMRQGQATPIIPRLPANSSDSGSPSAKIMTPHSHNTSGRNMFGLEMMDQPNMGESLWSC
ncbi:LOB domain-containing protein 4 [Asimina triloba]